MVFEDLQWADDALLDFIDYLMEWSRDHRLFILTMARPELLDRRPDWGSGRRFRLDTLEPLPPEAMGALMSRPRPRPPGRALWPRPWHGREGVPLYAVETIRMLLDRGQITQETVGSAPPPRSRSSRSPKASTG